MLPIAERVCRMQKSEYEVDPPLGFEPAHVAAIKIEVTATSPRHSRHRSSRHDRHAPSEFFYFTEIVTPIVAVIVSVPPASAITDWGKNWYTGGSASVGTRRLICTTPHGSVGALPAYRAGATGPPDGEPSTMSTRKPAASFTGPGGLRPPVAQGGSVGPKPVPQTETTSPLAAGFEGPLTVPSWFTAAA